MPLEALCSTRSLMSVPSTDQSLPMRPCCAMSASSMAVLWASSPKELAALHTRALRGFSRASVSSSSV